MAKMHANSKLTPAARKEMVDDIRTGRLTLEVSHRPAEGGAVGSTDWLGVN